MALINKLEAIGNAIREKTGGTALLSLDDMATEIANLSIGGTGDIPEDAFTFSGESSNLFAHDLWYWFIRDYGSKIKINKITSATQMFYSSDKLERIPFNITLYNSAKNLGSMFAYCRNIKQLPLVTGDLGVPYSDYGGTITTKEMVKGCYNLRNIPNDFFWGFINEASLEGSKKYQADRSAMFNECYSLRQLPDLTPLEAGGSSAYYSLYKSMITGCYNLDEATNIPVCRNAKWTSNAFDSTVNMCTRLKEFTFATNEDGTPIAAPNWKSQTINFNYYVGYCYNGNSYESYILNYNSGITADKKVVDDATYQALKNDSDWWTTDPNYSRYNHDSAVNTINSLPDVSASGATNTIKFKGDQGALTDGGAINTLTEEEIAVAVARGWTVSLT